MYDIKEKRLSLWISQFYNDIQNFYAQINQGGHKAPPLLTNKNYAN